MQPQIYSNRSFLSSTSHRPFCTTPIALIQELVEQGETQKALEAFKKINPKESTILLGNFTELSKKHTRGTLKEEDFLREKSKINAGLLDLLDS